MRVMVTGAAGFVGRELCRTLTTAGLPVRAALRREPAPPLAMDSIPVGEIQPDTDWSTALHGIDTVVHLAARVHVMRDRVADPLQEFRRINVAATEQLARSAARMGVRRMVFTSSVKVNGDRSAGSAAYSEGDAPRPADAYGFSKWEAEQALQRIAAETGLEVVIVRPPLVYGPGVKANFLLLMKLIARGFPLPLGSVDNRRSLIFVKNLTAALLRCIEDPRAANQVFLVSDGEDLSTPELIRRLARAMKRPARLIPFPPHLLRIAGRLLRRTETVERLVGSLAVESSKIRSLLDWSPPHSVDRGLTETADWFLRPRGG